MRTPKEWAQLKQDNPTHPDVVMANRLIDTGLMSRARAIASSPEMIERQKKAQENARGMTGGRNREVNDD